MPMQRVPTKRYRKTRGTIATGSPSPKDICIRRGSRVRIEAEWSSRMTRSPKTSRRTVSRSTRLMLDKARHTRRGSHLARRLTLTVTLSVWIGRGERGPRRERARRARERRRAPQAACLRGPPRNAVHRSAAPCSPTGFPRSTIGAGRLSFRVRNGTGRAPAARAADRWAAFRPPGTSSACPGGRTASLGRPILGARDGRMGDEKSSGD